MATPGVLKSALLAVVTTTAVCACHSTSTGGTATLWWARPTANVDGSPIGTITGYDIYYGVSPTTMTERLHLSDPTAYTYVVQHLKPGTYYFSVSASTADGTSAPTPPVATTVQ